MKNQLDIMQLIEEEDVEFIRLQFTDMWGNLKNIAVTPRQLERVIEDKFMIEGSALFDGLYDYQDELYLVPDFETFVILPWRPQHGKVGKVICDVCYADGTLCEFSPRTILKKVLEDADKMGYEFTINPECEFFLFHTDDNGNPTTVTHEKAGYLDVGPADFGENARRDMVLTLEEMGFDVESSHHAKAPAQHEIDFTAGETLEMADALVTFKFAIRSIAKRFGLHATFMPKPRTDLAGSGLHLNITLRKFGSAVSPLNEDGSISAEYASFIAGVLAHGESLCAITNPIVNSYKRIGSGFDAPSRINWSTKQTSSFIRLHKSDMDRGIELRFPDTSANPYLALAVCITAGLDGIKKNMELPAENNPDCTKLPGNLNDAVKQMVVDSTICDALGQSFTKIYKSVKKNEWKSYMLQVSDWEVNRYLIKM